MIIKIRYCVFVRNPRNEIEYSVYFDDLESARKCFFKIIASNYYYNDFISISEEYGDEVSILQSCERGKLEKYNHIQ